jgi:acyl-coenzyme A thioesterase PaaI-like protein
MKSLPHTFSCFVCGEANPLGLNLRFETDGKRVLTHFVPRAEHIGFKQTVHGGLVATVLDEAMVWACATQTKRFAFCAELNIRYRHPLRPGARYTAMAELTVNRRDKVFEARGELSDALGVVCAVSSGKYIPVPAEQAAAMSADFVTVPDWFGQ